MSFQLHTEQAATPRYQARQNAGSPTKEMLQAMGIFGSFKRASEVWDKSAKEVKGARKNRPKDEVASKRNQENQGKQK